MFDIQENHSAKMRNSKRIFVLEAIDGKQTNTSGTVDKRLFTGENNLNAIMDEQTCLWSLRYDAGIVPEPLQQKFTSFKKAKDFVEGYFKRRNVRIKDIID